MAEKRQLMQAPVRALDPDGFGIVTLLTGVFLVCAVALFCWPRAAAELPLAFWISLTGTVGGAAGALWTYQGHRRRKAAAKAGAAEMGAQGERAEGGPSVE
ncbi:MAG: hypothetical protein LBQ92_03460 [Propionibacteriaceae bacterium]|nr:hypothetical protein [Propionibacteriaceae bacterium]